MRLERMEVKNYKCLRNVAVDFSAPEEGDDLCSAQFLAGVNGSGKSCFLEALGLILTRAMQGEVPGFPFKLHYRIGEARVEVKSVDQHVRELGRLTVCVTENGRKERFHSIPEKYQPRRIVSCSSGVNHLMDSVLLSSPRESLASDIYDLAVQGDPEQQGAMERLLEQYRTLDANPMVFSIDEETARLVVPVLFAVVPGFRSWGKDPQGYFSLREELTARVDKRLIPVAFSLTVDETRLQRLLELRRNSPQYGLLEKLFRPEAEELGGPLHSWVSSRPILTEEEDSGERMARTAVFQYEPWPEEGPAGRVWNRRLSEEFDGDPMVLLNVLAAAWRSGVLRGVEFAFRRGRQRTLLGLETLSDGELMWLARMGLVLMSRLPRSAETLFLFDEPDVHFNNEWNMDFVKLLRRCSSWEKEGLKHEFLITTHSTLVLTDARAQQIHLFSGGSKGVEVDTPDISPFAAQQDELSRQLFSARPVGSYAMERVQEMLDETETLEDMERLIREVGPGYQRFRLYEQYFQMKKRQER